MISSSCFEQKKDTHLHQISQQVWSNTIPIPRSFPSTHWHFTPRRVTFTKCISTCFLQKEILPKNVADPNVFFQKLQVCSQGFQEGWSRGKRSCTLPRVGPKWHWKRAEGSPRRDVRWESWATKQMGKVIWFWGFPKKNKNGFSWGASPFQASNPDIHIRHQTLCDGTPDRRWWMKQFHGSGNIRDYYDE